MGPDPPRLPSPVMQLAYQPVGPVAGTRTQRAGLVDPDRPISCGRGEKIRTSDPLHPMQVRYQAALRPDVNFELYLH